MVGAIHKAEKKQKYFKGSSIVFSFTVPEKGKSWTELARRRPASADPCALKVRPFRILQHFCRKTSKT